MGTNKRPFYRIVVADARSPRDGRFIETLGQYDPRPDPSLIVIDEEKALAWLKKGDRAKAKADYDKLRQIAPFAIENELRRALEEEASFPPLLPERKVDEKKPAKDGVSPRRSQRS